LDIYERGSIDERSPRTNFPFAKAISFLHLPGNVRLQKKKKKHTHTQARETSGKIAA